jgi:TonB-linked SusC/RagA family outer membrane protein
MDKILLSMKLSVILLFIAVINVNAKGFAQKITLSEKDVPLKNVFSDLRKICHYDFIYTDEQIHNERVVSLDVRMAELKDVLDQLLKDLPLTYTIDDHTVVIRDKPTIAAPAALRGNVALITVAGAVQDAHGSPLSGASVATLHSKMGATTDVHGFFQLKNVPGTDTLIVSFIGYKTKKVAIGVFDGKIAFPIIVLEEATEGLDQVVVQGYGRTTQRLTTSDIGKVTAAEIAKQPVNDPLLAIEGKVAGVVVTPVSGFEGGPVKIEIRGRASLNSAFSVDPLYVIDGVPLSSSGATAQPTPGAGAPGAYSTGLDQTGLSYSVGQSPMYNINPADIESIEILKDADATAIYGSRGANGVILITTKRGKVGTDALDLNVSQGINFNTRAWPLLNTKDYLAMRREQLRNDGQLLSAATAPDLVLLDTSRYTDWQKYSYGGIGQATNVQGSISGGNDQTVYRLGIGYNRNTDITRITGADQRATVALSLVHTSVNKKLTESFSANYAYSIANQLNINGTFNLPPDAAPVFDAQGHLNYEKWNLVGIGSPFASLLQPYNSRDNGLTANLNLGYNILKGFKAGVSLGYNNAQNYQTRFTPIASQNPYVDSSQKPVGSNAFGTSRNNNWIIEPQLSYSVSFGNSKIDMLAGGTVQANVTDGMTVTGTGYTSDIDLKSISLAPKFLATDNYSQYKYSGVYARLTYNYDNRYILNFNGRRDGSSRFGVDNRFGNFGSVGAAWIMSDEKWLRKVLPEAISFVKLRGSYGTTGSDGVGEYQYLSQWGNRTSLSTYNGVTALIPLLEPNPDFHWQVNKKLEGALQLELFQSQISMELAWYRNRCDNQLVQFPLPSFLGFTGVTANDPANVQNSGFEATIVARPIQNKNFRWTINFNLGINRNKLLAYPNLDLSPYRNQYKIGQSINTRYLLHYAGIDPLTGLMTFKDFNHDGIAKVDESVFPGMGDDDRKIKIDQEPDYAGGFGSQLSYRTLTLSVAFTYTKQKGVNLLNNPTSFGGSGTTVNISQYVYDHAWRYPGQTNALFAKLSANPIVTASMSSSDAGWSDASYIRWSNLAMSYSLPSKIVKKTGLRNMSVNVQGYNIMIFSPYKGLDPEVRTFGGMPPSRRVTAGLSCSF